MILLWLFLKYILTPCHCCLSSFGNTRVMFFYFTYPLAPVDIGRVLPHGLDAQFEEMQVGERRQVGRPCQVRVQPPPLLHAAHATHQTERLDNIHSLARWVMRVGRYWVQVHFTCDGKVPQFLMNLFILAGIFYSFIPWVLYLHFTNVYAPSI